VSLWRTERLQAYIGESEVALARLGAGGRVRGADGARRADVEGGWQGALGAIDRLLAGSGVKGGNAHVVLGGAFASALILPWQEKLRGREDRQHYARHLYQKTYDEASGGMALVLGEGGYGEPAPAFFASSEMLAALHASFAACGAKLRTVEPLLVAVMNRFRKQISGAGDCVLVVAEVDHVHIALFKAGAWVAVRSRRLGSGATDLMRVVQREVSTLPASPAHLYLVEHTPTATLPQLAGVEVMRLRLVRSAAPGLALVH
jgi:hypothetical protein